jgi:hypothetical protein
MSGTGDRGETTVRTIQIFLIHQCAAIGARLIVFDESFKDGFKEECVEKDTENDESSSEN